MSDINEIATRIKDFIEREFPQPGAELTLSTNLLEEWFIDSLGIVNTTLFLESAFGIDVRRADINAANFRSIETLARYVAERLGGHG